jgi:hypothetical protein
LHCGNGVRETPRKLKKNVGGLLNFLVQVSEYLLYSVWVDNLS